MVDCRRTLSSTVKRVAIDFYSDGYKTLHYKSVNCVFKVVFFDGQRRENQSAFAGGQGHAAAIAIARIYGTVSRRFRLAYPGLPQY